MSILTKLQDLRTEEENTPHFDDVAVLWVQIRQIMASTSTWVTITATAPESAEILFPSSLTRGVVIFDYI